MIMERGRTATRALAAPEIPMGAIAETCDKRPEVAFGQLQGMADEISCELVAASKDVAPESQGSFKPQAYKYLVWGSTGECMRYLLRRAEENRDAVERTRNGRDAMAAELWRRMRRVFGLA